MADQECSTCHEPLLLEIEADSDVEDSKAPAASESIPDDVELTCGCHFHWECFLEAYNITRCPNCSNTISTLSSDGTQQVRSPNYHNPGLLSLTSYFRFFAQSAMKAESKRTSTSYLQQQRKPTFGHILRSEEAMPSWNSVGRAM